MATALWEPRDVQDQPVAAEVETDNARVAMNEEWLGEEPARYVVRIIDFNMPGTSLQFSYANDDLAQDLPAGGIAEVINNLRNPPQADADADADAAADVAAAVRETPLDLNVIGAPIYIILVLNEPNNMTFSSRLKALTHKKAADKPFYGRLRHATATAVSKMPLPGCKIVYFIADPPVENPPVPPLETYRHGFNFNVELEQDPRVPDGPPRILELSIDPDVRHPGGSET